MDKGRFWEKEGEEGRIASTLDACVGRKKGRKRAWRAHIHTWWNAFDALWRIAKERRPGQIKKNGGRKREDGERNSNYFSALEISPFPSLCTTVYFPAGQTCSKGPLLYAIIFWKPLLFHQGLSHIFHTERARLARPGHSTVHPIKCLGASGEGRSEEGSRVQILLPHIFCENIQGMERKCEGLKESDFFFFL